jgi:NAD-dependent deacetylase
MQDQIQQAADILARARRLVVLTGAGISKESGIPTFREAQQGLWA